MEKFDVYDCFGNKTGQTQVKGVINSQEYYLGIHVYIYNSSKQFLLQKRVATKNFRPNEWEILLEHAIAGEDNISSAIRGVEEELGLSFKNKNFQYLCRYMWHEKNHIVDSFLLKVDIDLNDIHMQKNELSDIKWVNKSEMLNFINDMKSYRPTELANLIETYIQKL